MELSAVVITWNEEKNIERCLEALRFCDEIVVVDSMSTDRTVEIASRHTDKVSLREFTGFSDQKSAAVALASGDWVLAVDADEIVSTELAGEIRDVIRHPEFDAYRIPRLSYFLGKAIRRCGWYPDYQLRLVRREKAQLSRTARPRKNTCGWANRRPQKRPHTLHEPHYRRLPAQNGGVTRRPGRGSGSRTAGHFG